MRIALFTDTVVDINGVARFIADLRTCPQRLDGQRCELLVLTCTRKPVVGIAGDDLFNAPALAAFGMPGYRLLDVAIPSPTELAAAVSSFGAEMVHVSTPGPVGLVGRGLALSRGLPLVGTYHTDFPAYAERIYGSSMVSGLTRGVMNWFYAPFRKLLVRSAESARQLCEAGGDCARLRVLPAGVDLNRFRTGDEPREAWLDRVERVSPAAAEAVRAERRLVLYVGRISREKNMALLVSTWREVLAGRGALRPPLLLVVGDGPGLGALRAELGAIGHAEAPGFATGQLLLDLYRCGSVLLFPSRTDTLGQVVLEAQAMGIPAIVSDAGGPRQLVLGERTGVVVRGQQARDWAEAVRRVIEDERGLAAMQRAAAAHAQSMPFSRTSRAFWVEHRKVLESGRGEPGGVK